MMTKIIIKCARKKYNNNHCFQLTRNIVTNAHVKDGSLF